MKIRTKFIVSNVLLILIPLAIGMGLLAIFISGPGNHYWETVEKIFLDENRIYSAQSLLHTYGDSEDKDQIANELTDSGYHFSISRDGKTVFSNIESKDADQAKKTAGELFGSAANYTVSKGPITVIHESYRDEGSTLDMMAIHTKEIIVKDDDSYVQRNIALYITSILLILLACTIIVHLILSWWVSRSVLLPLKKLSKGSELIRNGYLDFEMTHHRDDEMGNAIRDFEDMRQYLKDSVSERLKYEQYRRDLIIGISHDLRTPLTSIRGYVEGLRDGIPSTKEMEAKYYGAIESSIANLEQMFSALLEFSKTDGENYLNSSKRMELNDFYRSQTKMLNDKYVKDAVDVSFKASEGELFADIDPAEMERINLNLMENTLKYRKGDSSSLEYSLMEKDGFAEIRIADNGPGVAEEDLEKIFECFYRGDKARSHTSDGNGIGLAVVKRIVEGHGGNVMAENAGGLTIVISLPLKDPASGEDKH